MTEEYDSVIRRSVPRYEEMIDRLVDYLPDAPGRILELGCGTGNLSLRLAARFPQADIVFVDGSDAMTAVTLSRLRRDPRQLRGGDFVTARFEDLPFAAGTFDLVVSSISLHHVIDKAGAYRRIRELLPDGGRFCFADQIRGEPEANHQLNWSRWLEFCARPGHCSPQEIESLLSHSAAHDHYTPLAEHFDWLSKAGFTQTDCVWRNLMWGIVTATAA